eukprot:TRINITY_DN8164_c0_g2_i3.p1 TRINITY_DN8164_c0_g2~~TRINITY_DN8164_c0_g2_i3.p1  ORF type:complete len:684 (-),score=127.01 TRINITY_DN8164_c0_g2_i3:380-2269(-)
MDAVVQGQVANQDNEEFHIENGGEGDLDLQGYDQDVDMTGDKNTEGNAEEDTGGPQEWEKMEIPEEWKFLPTIRVKYVPKGVTEEELTEFLERFGVEVKGVFKEPTSEQSQKYSCIVRLAAQEYSESDVEEEEEQQEGQEEGKGDEGDGGDEKKSEDGSKKDVSKKKKMPGASSVPANVMSVEYPKDGDATEMAKWLLKRMASKGELVLQESTLNLEVPFLYICLVISNLPSEWEDETCLREECEKHGKVLRCFLVTNADGQRKGYAYVEYETYMEAKKAKEAFDRMTSTTFQKIPQMRAQAAQEGGPSKEAESDADAVDEKSDTDKMMPANQRFQIRIMRAEWAAPKKVSDLFGRHLYVANLKKGFDSSVEMKKVFEQYGKVLSCQIAKERGSGRAKDYGFVEFARSDQADAAMRQLDGFDHEMMGKLAVSFIPPSKLQPNQERSRGGRRSGLSGRGRGRPMRGAMSSMRGRGSSVGQQHQSQNTYLLPMLQQQQMHSALQVQQQQLRAMQMQQQQMALAQQQMQLQQAKAREELAQIAMQKQLAENELTQMQLRQQTFQKQQQQQQQIYQQQQTIAAHQHATVPAQTQQNVGSYYGTGQQATQATAQDQYGSSYVGATNYSSYNYPD